MKIPPALTRRAYYATTHVKHGTRMDPTVKTHAAVAAHAEDGAQEGGASQQAGRRAERSRTDWR